MVVSSNLDELVIGFTHSFKSDYHHNLIMQKAGIWQGIDAYKDSNMLVLRDVNYYLDMNRNFNKVLREIKPDKEWCDIHFHERVGGIPLNPGESYKIWPYAVFKEGDDFLKQNKFDHTYMERFWPKLAGIDLPREILEDPEHNLGIEGIRFQYGDLDDVIKQLIENPLTRQAYLPIFFPEDTGAKGNIRVPCTLGYLFEIVPGKHDAQKLNITYYIRSCDVIRHLRNDVYLAYLLAGHIQGQFNLAVPTDSGIKLGSLNMKIANLHLFENDTYALVKKENKLKELYNGEQENK